MKVKVIKDAFYRKAIVREGSVIDTDFNKKNLPSWAVIIEKTEIKEPIKNPIEEQSLREKLEKLKDIAIENNIFLNIEPNRTIEETISQFETELKTKGIIY